MPRIPKSIRSTRQILSGSRSGNPTAGTNSILQSVVAQSQLLLAIEPVVRRYVPEEVRVASLDGGVLTLITSSSAIATQVRYRQRNIVSSLRQSASHLDISDVRVLVRPESFKPEADLGQPRYLSKGSARHIAETAKYIEHQPLRKALLALSNRAENE